MEDITLNVGLEPGDIKSTAEELRGEIEKIFNSTSGNNTSVKFKQLEQQMAKAYGKSQQLEDKMKELENTNTPTEKYAELDKQLTQASTKAADLYDKISELGQNGAPDSTLDPLIKDYGELDHLIVELSSKMEQMKQNGTAFVNGKDTEEYKKLSQQLNDVNNQMVILSQRAQESGELGVANIGKFASIFNLVKSGVTNAISAIRQLPATMQGIGSSIKQMWGDSLLASSMFLNAVDAVKDKITNTVTNIKNFGQQLANLGPTIQTMVGNGITKLGTIVESVKNKFASFGAVIKSAVSDPLYTLDRVAGFTITAIGTLGAKFAQLAAMGIKGVLVGAATGAVSLAKGAASAAKNLAKFAVEKAKNGLKSLSEKAKEAADNLKKMVKEGIINGIKKLGSSLLGLNKSTKSSNNALQVGFKTLLRYGLGVRSVFFLIKRLRAQLIEGFGNLTQYSEPFNQTVSAFLSSLYTLKNSFAAAFAPIVSVVAPILTYFLNMLNAVIAKVGEFLYALTGQKTFIVAKKVQVDYAKSLDKSSNATDKASKATKKNTKATEDYQRTIAGFDDVEILKGPDKDNSADSTDTGAGSGAGAVTPTGADMFETKPISTAMSDFANKIRDFIKNQDWTGLGTFLGKSVNSIFAKAQEMISWENLGNKITKIVTAITKTLNAFVDAVDWELIGRTFATGINTIIYTLNLLLTGIDWYAIGNAFASGLNGLISNIDWAALGTTLGAYLNAWIHSIQGFVENFDWTTTGLSLATGLNNLVSTIDWSAAGSSLSTGIIGVLDLLSTAVENFDWEALGQNVAKFLGSIDWSGIATALFRAIGAVLGGLAAFLWGLIQGAWNSVVQWWEQTAFKDGQFTMTGLLKGILNVLANIGQWVYDHVFSPFIKAFKKAFGISSPSKVMKEQGKFVIEGLLGGIKEKWESIKTFFSNGVKKIKEFFTQGGWKKLGNSTVTELDSGLTDNTKWSKITSAVSGYADKIKGYFENISWEDIGDNIMSGIKNGIDNGWNWLSTTVWNTASNLLQTAKNALGIQSPSKAFRDTVGKMIPAGVAEGITDEQNLAMKAVVDMSDAVQAGAIKNIQIPAVVTGSVVPFASKNSSQDDANNALNRIIDMLEYNQSDNISRDDLRDILIDVIRDYLNFNFVIGDEQIARHANAGNAKLNRRYSPTKTVFT